jgi:menaquinone-dependent protoporphyrinogen oxidase
MTDVPVFYATTEGQTRRIAEFIAMRLREHALESEAISVESPEAQRIDWGSVRAAALGASLHVGRHQRTAAAFAAANRDRLNACPSAFFSVSLAVVSKKPEDRQRARRAADEFVAAAGWKPRWTACVAGRLAYTKYGFLMRFVMRQIAKTEGASTDTGRDHEYTDWGEVARFADEIAREVGATSAHVLQPAS